jgi:hypothetical protein
MRPMYVFLAVGTCLRSRCITMIRGLQELRGIHREEGGQTDKQQGVTLSLLSSVRLDVLGTFSKQTILF